MNGVFKEAIEIIKKVAKDEKAEVKIRLQANVFLKRNKEIIENEQTI